MCVTFHSHCQAPGHFWVAAPQACSNAAGQRIITFANSRTLNPAEDEGMLSLVGWQGRSATGRGACSDISFGLSQ